MKPILPMLCLLACGVAVSSDVEPIAIDLDELDWRPPGDSWTVPEERDEAVILVRRAGPDDFHFVED